MRERGVAAWSRVDSRVKYKAVGGGLNWQIIIQNNFRINLASDILSLN